MSKIENIFTLSRQTAEELSGGRWPEFLRTAAWNFKYSFPNQLLIFAQRPDATACADAQTWSEKLQRVVQPEATGIALLEDGGDYMRLNYIFDVSETYSPSSTPLPLWSVTPEKNPAVRAALISAYLSGGSSRDLMAMNDTDFFRSVAQEVVGDQYVDALEDLLSSRFEGEGFAGLTDLEVEFLFKDLLVNSVTAILMYRCGLEPQLLPNTFGPAALFQSMDALAVLGRSTQDISRQCLNVIARAVRIWDRTHKEEQHHETELSESRSVSDPGIDTSRVPETEPLREDAQELSAEQQAEPLHSPSDVGRADGTPGIGGDRDSTSGRADDGSSAHPGSEPDAGAAASAGGGTDLPADDLRLTEEASEPLPDASDAGLNVQFPSIEEQEAAVQASQNPNRLTVEEIDSILTNPSDTAVPRELLSALFRDNPGTEATAAALNEAYGALVFSHTFSSGEKVPIFGEPYGLRVTMAGKDYILDWHTMAERLRHLIESGRYQPTAEERQPTSSAELEKGSVFLLNGMKYQVVDLSDSAVLLQDTEHPIFTQTMDRSLLDILLKQSAPRPEPERPAAPTPEAAPEDIRPAHDLSDYSVSTLRYAVASVLRSNYEHLLEASEEHAGELPDEDEFEVILNDFTGEADLYYGETLTPEQEQRLRTPDENGKALLSAAFRMRSEQIDTANVDFSLRALQALYRMDEGQLYAAAETSQWISPAVPDHAPEAPAPEYALTPARENYRFLAEYAPEITDGKLDYIRFESDTYEPLYIERIGRNEIAIAHTYVQNGDLMYDPEIVFHLDPEKKALHPVSFQQSAPPIWQEVYQQDEAGRIRRSTQLEKDLNSFCRIWFQNLKAQEHTPVRGVKQNRDGDLEYVFDEDRNLVPPRQEELSAAKPLALSENSVALGDHRTVTFAPGDLLLFSNDDFEVDGVADDMVFFHSLQDKRPAPAAEITGLATQIVNGSMVKLIPGWRRPNIYDREDQKLLGDLLRHFEEWRTHKDLFIAGNYYAGIMDRMVNLRISEDVERNKEALLYAGYTVRHFFPNPDTRDPGRARQTNAFIDAADDYLNYESEFEDFGNVLRLSEWRAGGETDLFTDLVGLYNAYVGAELPEVCTDADGAIDFYAAIPALTAALRQSGTQVPDSLQHTFEQLLRAGQLYENDRYGLYPERREADREAGRNRSEAEAPVEWDHPELRRQDLSRQARADKVILADLMTHYADYRGTYRQQLPALSAADAAAYLEQCEELDALTVSDDLTQNLAATEQYLTFFQRWFLPVADLVAPRIQNDLNHVFDAGEQLLVNPPAIEAEGSEAHETPAQADPAADIVFAVGDEYRDAYGGGIITHVLNPDPDGRVAGAFGYKDPETQKQYVMDMPTASQRIRSGEATLEQNGGILPDWLVTPAEEPEQADENTADSEPSLFDFQFDPEPEPVPEPVQVTAAPMADADGRLNFRITEMEPNYGGPKARFQNNVAAIRLLKDLESEDRLATPEEQTVLSKYVGWGGLPQAFDPEDPQWHSEYEQLKELLTDSEYASARESTLTAFYTPPVVVEAIYEGLRNLGFSRGNILDPCCATGNFFGMLPDDMKDSRLYGVELDSISGRIGRQLYQQANILIEGYEKASLPDSIYDVAIGNVPFGNYQLADRRYDKEHFLIHDYFFAKTLDKVRPGGIVAFVTSKGTMDKKNDSVRKYIAKRADLLGAIRLPDNVFQANAGTEAVSDIIFLRKRERPSIEEPYWVGLDREFKGVDWENRKDVWGAEMNAYFVDNPDMVLGEMTEVSGPHGPVWTCRAREGEDLREALKRAVANIEGQIGDLTAVLDDPELQETRHSIPADPAVRNFSFTVVDGDVYFREDSQMFRADLNKTAEQRVKGMVEIRDVTRALIDAQVNNASDAAISALQEKLNQVYDKFTAKYGILNSRGNELAFSDDSSYYLLCSLEHLDDEGNFKSKADMFYKRTIGQHREITHVDTAEEALGASLGELARIDLDYMSSISDLSKEDLIHSLDGIIFPVPGKADSYEISSVYLSGNIREKLAEARQSAENDPRFESNVKHLEQAMPEPLGPESISVRLGSTWVSPEDYKNFMFELLDMPDYLRHHMNVIYSEYTDTWNITNKHWPSSNVKADTEFGTKCVDAYRIIEQTLNLRDVQVFDTVELGDGSTRRVLNVDETMAAQEKQQLIKDAFKEWIWKDPDRRDRLCALYNERFNSVVPPTFSGDMVRFHGLNPSINLDAHQKESVARILFGGNTLLAHTVGAGKTWTMTAAAMEGKYLGLCNKSLIMVPNHLVGQWAAAIYEAYPQANVLASSKKDFEPANRKKFCSRIATGDYDIVVIGHSQFEKIPLSAERQEATLREQLGDILSSLNELKAQRAEHFTIKEMERARKNLESKLDKLQNSKKRDDVISFEELGVDRLFVDESHEFKNLFLYTKMHNVAGVSQTDSQKASDLFMKCRYMDELTGNKGNIHATGTPVSNTMAEVYTTQRFLQYDALKKMGLGSFDAWASTFGETVVTLELAPEGNGYRPRTRFAKFFNLPELMNMYKQVADIRTKDMLDLPLPAVQYETIALKPSEDQVRIVQSLGDRAEKIRQGGVNNREDNMLCITNDGRKLALDQRIIDPTLPDNPNSKANACADNVYRIWKEHSDTLATQLIFCDLSTPTGKKPVIELQEGDDGTFSADPEQFADVQFTNVYEDLKEKLIQRGIPADEIRFIHEAKNETQKEALFAKVRSGAVRVLMGSTGKMGTGTNVQDLLIAGHDLDCPWRPSDLEQRAGRVERRGNTNEKVFMYRYVTEGTFDAYMYQLLEAKQRFISQIFTSKNPAREANDVDDATLGFAEIKALSSGDPRIREKVALEIEVSKLEMLKNRHQSEQYQLDQTIRHTLPNRISLLSEVLPKLEKDSEAVKSHPSHDGKGNMIPIDVKGVSYETATDAGKAILAALDQINKPEEWRPLGTFRGFRLLGRVSDVKTGSGHLFFRSPMLALSGERMYTLRDFNDSAVGVIQRLNNILDRYLPNHVSETQLELSASEKQLDASRREFGKPFAREEELQEKKSLLAALDAELNLSVQKSEGTISDQEPEPVPDVSRAGEKKSLSDIIANASQRAQAQQTFVGQEHTGAEHFSRS